MTKLPKICIIDYGMGNLQSVLNASNYVGGCDTVITDDPDVIRRANGLILPGVGAFEDAMEEMKNRKLMRPPILTIPEMVTIRHPQ